MIENGNSFAQYAKFLEEGTEILVAMNKFNELLKTAADLDVTNEEQLEAYRIKDKSIHNELVDGLGDTLVTLIILAAQYGLELEDCLEYAYNEIKDRTGKDSWWNIYKRLNNNYLLIGCLIAPFFLAL